MLSVKEGHEEESSLWLCSQGKVFLPELLPLRCCVSLLQCAYSCVMCSAGSADVVHAALSFMSHVQFYMLFEAPS